MNDDAGFHVFHAACAAALAIDIQGDLYTFFRPPAPFHQFFVLTPQEAGQSDKQGGAHAVNGHQRDQGSSLEASVHRWNRWYAVEHVEISESWLAGVVLSARFCVWRGS